MGLCNSAETQNPAENSSHMREEAAKMKKIVRLLLLGTADSGKSTLLKQMKILHGDGFTADERLVHRETVIHNIVEGISQLVLAMHSLGIPFGDPKNENAGHLLATLLGRESQDVELDQSLVDVLVAIWSDAAVREQALPHNSEFPFAESTPYFLDSIGRIAAPDYIPSVTDILMLRVPTCGIVEVRFTVKERVFNIIDVGGQRSERKKWIHCFDNVNAIIFVLSLSEFDQTLFEDRRTNRMEESLRLFRSLCNCSIFYETPMIMFLNKKDLFAQKISEGKCVSKVFKDYTGTTGPDSYKQQVYFVREKFAAQNSNSSKVIYMHETCATDTNQIQLVMLDVFDMILLKLLQSSGIM